MTSSSPWCRPPFSKNEEDKDDKEDEEDEEDEEVEEDEEDEGASCCQLICNCSRRKRGIFSWTAMRATKARF